MKITGSAGHAFRRRVAALVLTAGTSVLWLAACSDDNQSPAPVAAPSGPGCATQRAADADAERLPSVFTLDGKAEVIGVTEDQQGYSMKLQLPMSVEEAYNAYYDNLPDAGFEVMGEENEGFEAEVYFDTGKGSGFVQVREIECSGRISSYVKVVGERLP